MHKNNTPISFEIVVETDRFIRQKKPIGKRYAFLSDLRSNLYKYSFISTFINDSRDEKYITKDCNVKGCFDGLTAELKGSSSIKPGLHLINITDECQVPMIARNGMQNFQIILIESRDCPLMDDPEIYLITFIASFMIK